MKTTTMLTSDSINPFDNLPNEILQYLLSFTNHHGMLVCKRFLEADRKLTKNEAQESFKDYLMTRTIHFDSVNPLKIIHLITVFALDELPKISDPKEKEASIGILLLQLYEVLYFYTNHNQVEFTLPREPDVLESSVLAVSYLITSNDESDTLRTSISEKDIDKIKDDVGDMLAFLTGTNPEKNIKTCYFNETVTGMMQDFKAGMKHALDNTSGCNLRFFSFTSTESRAQMILRLINQCASLLENQLSPPQPSCTLF
ncbi:hypothetical protein OQJ18_07070 [Fluoribacter dumoffii]|uniref:Uncharacterized protein n=1 Tax=Fluoribacter dumoffii TaxID=463 RepID=A0A377G949_9GAMM|nr:hypothetical protein [Fluoribacter dumoffii]KTC89795.1 hypothetical protein Ldum_0863 [Fluoribacter dumoffii NY 23]MCW8385092.1 hypothetical protein [Fluoribacter dumoffii]MCW8418148.1 hypothetical protein [Fluoribacter dumoffii]MCW8454011.1 hypothetical protein [Fluoribacter dumoffii]MCW8461919.1 hypothetical protein [Fluoribacter dumoffii]